MTKQIDYGKTTKRIVFVDSDHRHAQLVNRLRYDNLSQAEFFRIIVGGYIAGDDRIQNFVDEFKNQSVKKRKSSKKLKTSGIDIANDLGLNDETIEDIFDLIAEEHPDL